MIDLNDLMRLREAATPGPWGIDGWGEVYGNQERVCRKVRVKDLKTLADYIIPSQADILYITAAGNAVPELVQRIRELEAQCDWLAQTAANAGWHGVRVGKEYMIDQARMAVSHAQAERHECPTPEVSCHAREGKLCMSDNHLACAQADNLQR